MKSDILVCLEGSASSEAASRTAIEIAREQGTSLTGLAIVDEPDIVAGEPGRVGSSAYKRRRDEILLADARARADEWVAGFATRCRESGVSARTVEAVGRPADSIVEELERHDLTLIGRDANFRFETEDSDTSTRAKILRRAKRPVMLVPAGDGHSRAALGKTVLVAYDGGAPARHVLDGFVKSGLAESREIHVATVADNGAQAWEVANGAVETLNAAGLAALAHNIVSVLPTSEAIMALARDLDAGLVVMGAFGHSRMVELFRGSDTLEIVKKSQTPLCLQH
jgi:nucleotide-binding universal stress UspA family protein